ncbi:MAG: hypothetical protein ACJA0V_002113 [Planctomycetota bacterium]|jgi:hypothetical protein
MSKQITNIFTGDRRAEVGLAATFLLAIVAAVGGLAIGPGQVIWCLFLSGSEAASYEIQSSREVVVPLAPDQNPLRFMARVAYLKPNRHIGTMVTAFDGVLRRVTAVNLCVTMWSIGLWRSSQRMARRAALS